MKMNSSAILNMMDVLFAGMEIFPLCSSTGENREAICRGRTFDDHRAFKVEDWPVEVDTRLACLPHSVCVLVDD